MEYSLACPKKSRKTNRGYGKIILKCNFRDTHFDKCTVCFIKCGHNCGRLFSYVFGIKKVRIRMSRILNSYGVRTA
jgi:hypothetical protein